MYPDSPKIYEFEDFRLDARNLLLFRGDQRLTLRPKVVETLLALVERNGQVIHKDELMNIVWPGTIVEEGNLSQNLYLLRKTLGVTRGGDPFIETLHRRGYCFSAEVHVSPSPDLRHPESVYAGNEAKVSPPVKLPVLSGRRPLYLAVVSAVFLAVAAFIFFRSNETSTAAQGETAFIRLTNGGDINDATISPDGKYFVYHEVDGNTSRMWLQQTGNASRIEIIPPTTRSIASKTFSPDGQNIYFIASETPGPEGSVYRVPVIGGVETKIVDAAGLVVAISPNGRQLAFLRNYADRNITDLIIADSDGGSQRKLMTSRENHVVWGGLAWSPDGRSIAYGELDRSGPTRSGACTISAVDPESGATRVLSTEKWDTCGRMAWAPDNNGLMFIGTKENDVLTTRRDQLYYLSVATGKSRRLTIDTSRNQVASLGVTNDNSVLIVPYNRSSQLWVMDSTGDAATAKQITNGLADGRAGIAPLPDGRIGYIARTGDSLNIWTVAIDGSDPRQITVKPDLMEELRSSADGRYFYYSSPVDEMPKLFRCETDGSDPRQVLSDPSFSVDSSMSPDGKWIVYNSAILKDGATFVNLRMAPGDGGDFMQVTDFSAATPHFSPDGRLLSYRDRDDSIGVITMPDGKPVAKFAPSQQPMLNVGARWFPDGKALTYIIKQKTVGNIWIQALNGDLPRPLTNFTSGDITNYAFSIDGTHLIVARGYPIKDAVLIRASN